ncbi:titin-like, partial [Patiria miniata]|uniref:Titin n=1 Tax=Patiria miniata TaxID=46514 RepID=A0A913Z975_PATMI
MPVEVKRAPSFTEKPEVPETPETTDAVFRCKVDGFPKPTITWNKGWKQIKPAGRFSITFDEDTEESILTIEDTTSTDAGKYTCYLKSPLGQDSASVSLKITEKPKEEKAEQVTVEQMEEVDVLADVSKPEEVIPEVMPVEGPEETVPEKRPSVKEAPEEVKMVLKPQVSLDAVSEEKLEIAGVAKVPKTEEVEILIETEKPEEVVVEVEEAPTEVTPERKPAVIAVPEEIVTKIPKAQVAMEAVTEEQLETAVVAKFTPHEEEEVEILAEIKKPEEVIPAVVSIEEAPEEVETKRKPAFIIASEEELTKKPKAKVALEDVTEEKLETAVMAKVKPRSEEQVQFLAAVRKPEEAVPTEEEAPEEVTPKLKPAIISAPEELVTPAPVTQEYLDIVTEEELETAVTKVAPQPEDEADLLPAVEKITPVEAVEELAPSEVTLDVSEKPVTIRGMPEKEVLPEELLEAEAFPEEEIEKHEAVEVVVEEEEKVEEMPVAPVIIDQFKSKSTKEGKPVKFTCTVTGTPKPEIKWFLNKELLEASTHFIQTFEEDVAVLTIEHPKPKDTGEYKCVVINTAGEDVCTAKLTVTEVRRGPSFIEKPEVEDAPEGTEAIFRCKVDGFPKPTVTWNKGWKQITTGGKFTITFDEDTEESVLTIKDTTPSDAGKYTCYLKNPLGQETSSVSLKVTPKPEEKPKEEEITPKPEEKPEEEAPVQEVEQVEEIFEVSKPEEVSPEEVTVEEVEEVPEEKPEVSVAKLDIEAVTEEKAETEVAFKVKPHVKEEVVLPVTTEFEEISIEVVPEEETKPEEVPERKPAFTVSSEEEVTKVPKAKVSVKAVTEEQVDSAVTAKFKPRKEEEVEVQAAFKRPEEEEIPEAIPIEEEAAPKPATTFAEEIAPSEVTLDVSEKPVTIRGMPEKEVLPEELLEAEAFPEETVEKHEAVEVVVEEEEKVEELPIAPVITDQFKSKSTKEGKPVKFTCTVTGTPKPEVKWFLNKDLLEASTHFIQTFEEDVATLTIEHPKPKDTGEYKCVVISSAGEDVCTAKLTVTEVRRGPSFVEKPEVEDTPEGTEAIFRCKVDGFPKPTVTWNKGWKQITTGGKFTITFDEDTEESVLTIKDTTPSDAGKYTCYLKNPLGQETSSVSLKVTPKPEEKPKEEEITPKPEEKPEEEAPVQDVEQVEEIPEVSKPEEVSPEEVTVEEVEAVPEEKPKLPIVKLDVEAVTEEKAETEVAFKVKPRVKEEVVLPVTTELEEISIEIVPEEETKPEEVPERKPAFTVSSEEEVTKVPKAKVSVKAVTEEQVDSAVTAKFKPRKEEEVEVQAAFKRPEEEEISEAVPIEEEAAPKPATTFAEEIAPSEVTLDVSEKPVTIRGMPEKEVLPEELLEAEALPEETVEKHEADEVVVEEEEKVEELPIAPVITDQFKSKSTKEGKPVKFTCTVTGTPKPEVKWFLNKDLLEASTHFIQTFEEDVATLTIEHPKPKDTGEYKCVVISSAGEDVCTAKLTVTEVRRGPSFVEKPEVEDTPEGTEAIFRCKVDGFPKPTVTWNKGWKQITTGGKFTITFDEDTEESVLTIKDTTPSDAGKYTCYLKNPLGQETSSLSLKVTPKPEEKPKEEEITPKPEEKPEEEAPVQEVEQVEEIPEVSKPEEVSPEEVTFEEVEAVPEEKPKVPIAKLDVEAVTEEKAETEVAFKVKPHVKEEVVLPVTTEFEEISIEVVPEEETKPEEVPERKPAFTVSSEEEVTKVPKAKVSVKAVTEEQVDSAVTAKFKPRKEEEVEVQAAFKRPEEEEIPEAIPIEEEAAPKPATTFAEEIAPSEVTLDVSEKPVTIRGMPEKEVLPEELLEAEAFPEEKVEKHEAVEMVVEEEEKVEELPIAPVITDQFKSKSTKEGKPVKFTCTVTGKPKPEVKWFLNKELLEASTHFIQTFEEDVATLTIEHPKPKDTGEYKCVVISTAGEDVCTAKLTVTEVRRGPSFVEKPEVEDTPEGTEAIFRCKVDGFPQPTITWNKGWKQITTGGKFTITFDEDTEESVLTIKDTTPSDAGKYTCFLKNPLGQETSSVSLKVTPKPEEKPKEEEITPKPEEKPEEEAPVQEVEQVEEIPEEKPEEVSPEEVTVEEVEAVPEEKPKVPIAKLDVEAVTEEKAETEVAFKVKPRVKEEVVLPVTTELEEISIEVVPEEETKPEEVPERKPAFTVSSEEEVTKVPKAKVSVKAVTEEQVDSAVAAKFKPRKEEEIEVQAAFKKPEEQEFPEAVSIEEEAAPKPKITFTEEELPYAAPAYPEMLETLPEEELETAITKRIRQPTDEADVLPSTEEVVPMEATPQFAPTEVLDISEKKPEKIRGLPEKEVMPLELEEVEAILEETPETLEAVTTIIEEEEKVEELPIAPVILHKIKDKNVKEGTPMKFTCTATGQPEPEVKWFRDGTLLKPSSENIQTFEADTAILSLPKPKPRDAGEYKCVVINPSGEDYCTAKLTVQEVRKSPKFEEKPTVPSTPEGTDATFRCKVEGFPKPEVTWTKGWKQLTPGAKIDVSFDDTTQESVLTIKDVKPTDAGKYTCKLKNQLGEEKADVSLVVTPKPKEEVKVPEKPEVKVVKKPEEKAEPLPTEEVKPSKPEEIPTEVTPEKIVPVSKPEVEAAPVKEPEGPAKFVAKPGAFVESIEDEEAIITYEISDELTDVKWFKEGEEIQPGEKFEFKREGRRRSLIIKDATLEDKARYMCLLPEDKAGTKLFVKETVHIINIPEETTIKEAEKGILEVEFNKDVSRKRVTFFKDGKELKSSKKYKIVRKGTTATLTINDVLPEDAGEYTVTAEEVKATVRMFVDEKPKPNPPIFVQVPKALDVTEGETATFRLKVGGTPTPTVQWFKGWREITPGDEFSMTYDEETDEHRFTIHSVSTKDAGKYQCQLSSENGKTKYGVSLMVQEKPAEEVPFNIPLKRRPSQELRAQQEIDIMELLRSVEPKDYEKVLREAGVYDFRAILKQLKMMQKKLEIEEEPEYEELPEEELIPEMEAYQMESPMFSAGPLVEPPKELPKILKDLQSQRGDESEDVEFTCELTDDLPEDLEVTWFKAGTEIEPSEKYEVKKDNRRLSLVVHDLKKEDQAAYTVMIGERRSSATLQVKGFTVTPLHDTKATEFDQTATFDCTVSSEKAVVTWLKDGERIEAGPKYEIKEDGKKRVLVVHDISPEDKGNFSCVVGDAESMATLDVEATKITKPLKETETPEKETVTITCEISHEKGVVKWLKDGKELPDSPRFKPKAEGKIRSLVIEDVQRDDEGDYTCVVGDDKTTAGLFVEPPPVEFLTELTPITVTERQTAEFICEVSDEKAEVTWLRDGKPIEPSDKYLIVKRGRERRLSVTNTEFPDESDYTCVIGDRKTSAELLVDEAEPEITVSMQDVKVSEDQEATFVCELDKDTSDVVWLKNGKKIEEDDTKFEVQRKGRRHSLIVKDIGLEDAANYTCKVGRKESSASLIVEEKPIEFTEPLQALQASPGDTSTFECTLNKDNVDVVWMRNGKEIKPTDHFVIKKDGKHHQLTVKGVQFDDDAEYTVKVKDVESKSSLVVQAAPKIEIDTDKLNITVKAGTKIVVEATVIGSPVPTTTWSKDEIELHPDKRITMTTENTVRAKVKLTIDKSERTDLGEYTITAANDLGSDTVTVKVIVLDKPQPPNNLRITSITPVTISLIWEPPEDDGGSPITEYIIEKRDMKRATWSKAGTTTSTELEFTVSKLLEGNEYLFRVSAVNKHGQSEPRLLGSPVVAKHQFDVPHPPSKPQISDIDSSKMTVTWSPPEFNGGSEITGYVLERQEVGRDRWVKVNKVALTDTTFTCTDLIEGKEYIFRVVAENKAGLSKPSEPSDTHMAKPPYDVPGAPSKPKPENIDATTISITWNPPESDGGSPVTGYIIERCDVSRGRWVRANREKVTELTFKVTDLVEGNKYQFRVSAENLAGVSKPSEPSDTIVAKLPYDVPGAPERPTVSDIDSTQMTVTWSPPSVDGGSPVTGYILERKEKTSSRWTKVTKEPVTETTLTVKDLIEGKEYEFRVAAINKAGTGPFSEPSEPRITKPPYDVPGAPEQPTVSDIDSNQMTVTWETPSSDGGSPITGYILERKEKTSTRWTRVTKETITETTLTVKDLNEGKEYEFHVAAVNKAGTGPFSKPSDLQKAKAPYDVPGPPDIPTVSDIDSTKMTVTWTVPSTDGGSPVTGYIPERKDKTSTRWMRVTKEPITETTLIVKDLIEGKEYEFHVAAVNKAGTGPFSEPSQPQKAKPPYDVPGAPEKPEVTAVDRTQITISWSTPESDGGSPITGYIIEKKDTSSTRWTKAHRDSVTETTLTVKDLIEGKEYEFRVAAVNKAGTGPFSAPSEPRITKPPYDVPGAPEKPEVTAVDRTQITISWSPPESDGGSPITGYIIEKKDTSSTRWTKAHRDSVTETTLTVKDLIEGKEYEFRVAAVNKAGTGPFSAPSEPRITKPPYDVPGAPEKPEVTAVDRTQITISWSPPESDGGSPITGYIIEKKDTSSTRWTKAHRDSVTETTLTVKDLIEGKEYEFHVAAVNKAGTGPFSAPSEPRITKPPYDVPGVPEKPEVTAVDRTQITISWSPPESDGGSPITGYIIEKKDTSSTRWTKAHRDSVTETTLTVKDLIEGKEYEFRVAAVNKAGTGPFSAPSEPRVTKPPYDVPGAPEKPEVTAVDRTQITISWSPPESDGGSPVTGYIIEKKDTSSTRWTKAHRDSVSETTLTVKDLIEGKEYEFHVAAVNKAGTGPFSAPSEPRITKPPYDVPGTPEKPEVTAVDRTQITISWSPPESDGGSPITGYIIEKKDTSSTRWTKAHRDSVTETTLTVKDLIEGKEYAFHVAAVNKAGTGPFSAPSEPRITKPPYDVPGAPEKPEETAVDRTQISISWSPPESDGGNPVTGYIIEKKETSSTRWTKAHRDSVTETTLTVKDLIEGNEYEFRVAAVNKAGTGPFSAPSEPRITKPPYDVPGAPEKPEVTAVDRTQITISWSPPESDGGSPITGYIIEKKDTSSTRWTKGHRDSVSETTLTVKDLIEGKEYEFRVAAVNKAGTGPFSAPSEPKITKPPYDVPGAPEKPEVTAVDRTQITISWSPPESDGGSPITGYIIEKKDTSSTRWTKAHRDSVTETTLTVKDLIEGKEYAFHVAAVNKAGTGPFSAPSEPRITKPPYDVPGAPEKPEVTAVDRTQISISWSPPESDGGNPVTGYIIEKKETSSTRWTKAHRDSVTETTLTVKDLIEGNEYEFRVAAVNKAGTGPFSAPSEPRITKPPYDVPGAPEKPEVTAVDRTQITISWSPPESDGGSPITGYIIEKKDTSSTRWTKGHRDSVSKTTLTVKDLIEGKEYEFHVAAVNKAGTGPFSAPSEPRITKPPYDVPGAPEKPEVTAVDRTQITISWSPPESDGGSAITGYIIEKKDTSSTRWTKAHRHSVTETTLTVKDLIEGKEYAFHVAAVNKAGTGQFSAPSEPRITKPPYDVPGAPEKPDVTAVDSTHISTSWSPPESDGGSPITGYIIEKKETSSTRWTKAHRDSVTETSLTVKDLIEGKEYEFHVAAVNKAGTGPFSAPSEPRITKPPYDVPGAPEKPEVTAVDRTQITISWSPPESDGGSPITGYIIEKKDTSSTRWTKAHRDSVSKTTLTVKDLIEGKEYEFRVAAVNKAGTGPFSAPSEPRITKPPYDVPGAPEKPKVTAVDRTQITISWSPPESDGGSPITGYIIEKKDTSSTRWTKAHRDSVTETTLTVKDLIEGKEYEFHVAAVNKAGTGPFSAPSEPRITKPPYDVPGAPEKPEVIAVDKTQITISWSPSESDGGSPITGYIIEKKETSSTRWTKAHRDSVTGTTLTVKDLIEGNEYEFRVAAVNKAGTGPFSAPSEPRITKPPYDVPGAPEKPEVTAVDRTQITISWSPPESDGGSPITGYVIEKKDTSSTRWTKAHRESVTETTLTVKDLIEGKEYEFRVAAVNKAGTGPFSAPSKPRITKPPYDAPGAPEKPEVTAVDKTQITISWSPPESDGGSPITGYIIEKKDTSSTRWTKAHRDSVTETTLTVKDLIEGKEYEFRVAAVNKAGTGPFSAPSEPRITKPPYDVPGAPEKPEVTAVDKTQITISWSPPESDGGSPITGYIIEKKETSSTRWTKAH